MGMRGLSRRDFVTTAAAAACSGLLPTASTAGAFPGPFVEAVKKNGEVINREKASSKARPFPLKLRTARRRALPGCHGGGPAVSPFPAS